MKYLLIGLLLISVAVFAEDNGTVILTSDNEADLTAAEAAASLDANATVVTSPWGEDTNGTLENISAKHPKEIIIIGGPVAIPAELEAKLKEKYRGLNVSIIRVYGKDRYETATAIITQFWGNASDVVIVQGDDIREMKDRLLEAKQNRIPVLYVKSTGFTDEVKVKMKMWNLKKARMYLSPDANETKIDDDLNETEVRNVTKVKEKLAERALEALADAKEAIDEANAVINVTNETNTTTMNMTIAASRLLALAQNEYADANASFENASYGRAFGQAVAARAHAKSALKIYEHVLSGDFMEHVSEVQKEIRERGMEKVREQAKQELEKAKEEFKANRMTRRTVTAVVRAEKQDSAGEPQD